MRTLSVTSYARPARTKFAIVSSMGPERRFEASNRTPHRSFSATSPLTWNHAFVFA
jgi:hypothetical protein